MALDRRDIFIGLAGSVIASVAKAQPDPLGRQWFVHEELPDGQFWDGVWRRREGSNVFDAEWRNGRNGAMVYDVIEVVGFDGRTIRLFRHGNNGTYFGELSPGGLTLRGGTSWYPAGAFWTAQIRG